MKNNENQGKPTENKGQVRKMKENQWKTQGKASQTEKQKKIPKKEKSPQKNPSPQFIVAMFDPHTAIASHI